MSDEQIEVNCGCCCGCIIVLAILALAFVGAMHIAGGFT